MGAATVAELALQAEVRQLRERIAELESERQIPAEIIEKAPVMISIVRAPDFVYELANPAFQTLAPGKKFLGHRFADVWAEVSAPLVKILQNVIETGRTFQIEDAPYTIQRGPGAPPEVVYVSYSWIPLSDPGGKPNRVLTLAHETTGSVRQRQRLAAALDQAVSERNRLDAVMESLPVGVSLLDGQGGSLRTNPAFERIWGSPLPPASSITDYAGYKAWWVRSGRPVQPGEWASAIAVRKGEAVTDQELEIERFDGGRAFVLNGAAPIRDANGQIVGSAVAIMDITERKQAEERLFETTQRLQALMEALPVGVSFSDDPTCQRITGNPAVLAEFEVGPEDNLSASALDPTAPGRQVRFFKEGREISETELPLQQAVRQGRMIPPVELEVRLPSGRIWIAEGSGAPVYDRNGNVLGGVAVTVDITERKRSEERLRHAQKLESLGLLAAGVAHDFNNLLVGVIGNASLAQEMLPPDHAAAELMATVVKTGEQAAHLTRQMLAYSGKGRFLVEPLDISALVSDIIELIRPSIPKKIALGLELDEELPSIEADRGQVQQILMNLAINAAEAIGSRDGQVTVRTGTQVVNDDYLRRHPEAADLQPGPYVVLEVHDTGCGMDGATKAKIFDPFFSTKFTGRGLGLAAVAGVVRGHKGAIVVTSAPGKGTTFSVLLPPAAHPAKGRPGVAASAVQQGSGVVLVIDDEHVVRDMAKKSLERHGYTVLVADGGLAAIDILKRYPGNIDLAVLDLSMPGMSGEETLRELRKLRPEVKIFVSSGYSEAEAMTTFRGQRVTGFVQKPYTSALLAEKVKGALG